MLELIVKKYLSMNLTLLCNYVKFNKTQYIAGMSINCQHISNTEQALNVLNFYTNNKYNFTIPCKLILLFSALEITFLLIIYIHIITATVH